MDKTLKESRSAEPANLAVVRFFFLLTIALACFALPDLFERGKESGHTIGTYSMLWIILLGVTSAIALMQLSLFILLHTPAGQTLARQADRFFGRLTRLGRWNGALFFVPWVIYVFLVLYRYQKHFTDFVPQVWMFSLAVGIGAVFVTAFWKKHSYFLALLFTTILYGMGVKAIGYLPDISAYPFSLSWSEASRYYYASLPYSKILYGFQIPLSFLHPSRYLLQSMAFWIPGAPLWFHRLWQVLLWLSLSLLTGWVLARRFHFPRFFLTLAVAAWAALFLLEGPVYYHLLVCVILVLIGFDFHRFWKTLIFVGLASAWAGISRVNWIPVPAMIAASLYLIEKPLCTDQGKTNQPASVDLRVVLRYLWPPLAWGIAGGLAALASQAGYMLTSGHEDTSGFGSSFTSALLWYRLFPSPTFSIGVLPAILLVSAPLLALIGGSWLRGRAQWHWLRILGIAGMLGGLFLGGLVVSTKIGGGSNIHNLDAFSSLLLVVGCGVGFGRAASESGTTIPPWRPWALTLAIVILPVIWCINVGDPFVKHDFNQAAYDLNKLNGIVRQYAPKGEILFITQRQLEIFKYVPGLRIVPDYELLTLTEMSISNNQAYFDHFNQDLRSHRFALIVADRQQQTIKNPALDGFAEENNAWVQRVSLPILKYYQEEMFFDTQGIQLLVPKQ